MAYQTLEALLPGQPIANAAPATPYTFSSVQSPASVAVNTTAEQSLVVAAGLVAVTDYIGVDKPTAQAGLGIVGARVIDPTHVGVVFSNNTAAPIIPTASESYLFGGLRPGVISQTILGVAPSAESQGSVQINKLSLTAPSLVTGVATNNVTINFRKLTAGVATVIGTITLAVGVNLAAEVEVAVVATTTVVAPGDVLDVQVVTNGTGMVLPANIVAKVEVG